MFFISLFEDKFKKIVIRYTFTLILFSIALVDLATNNELEEQFDRQLSLLILSEWSLAVKINIGN